MYRGGRAVAYRRYENPRKLEKRLAKLRKQLKEAYALGADVYELQDLELEIAELKERINFAWQDEYEEDY
jgi:hypothetical protein